MNWFFLSLVTLLAWSGSDLFSKMGSKPADKHSHWKIVAAVGLIMGLHAVVMIIVNLNTLEGEIYQIGRAHV